MIKNRRNPVRRNRNIGTARHGYRRQSRFVIPESWHNYTPFSHKLEQYKKVSRLINGKTYHFIVENTRSSTCHACTIDDLEKMIGLIPKESLDGLHIIVLRQPKRKEEILSSVWGRLIYYFEIDHLAGPAIVLEAVNYKKKLKWNKKLSVFNQRELNRLLLGGISFSESKRAYIAELTIESVRSIQLYGTFLHEVGHYEQYLECGKRELIRLDEKVKDLEKNIDWENDGECPQFNRWEKLTDKYHAVWDFLTERYKQIPTIEKEKYASGFSDRMLEKLEQEKLIPFDRVFDSESIRNDNLREMDFMLA